MPMVVFVLLVLSFLQFPSRAQADGRVYVADQTAGVVRKYSLSGDDLGVLASGLHPGWITADSAGNIYVSGGRVTKFSPSGELLLTISPPFSPGGVRVADDASIYVADYFGHAIHRYSASGAYLGVFVSLPALARADFIEFDAGGNLYVTDFMTGVIQRISPIGQDLGNFVSGLSGPGFQGPEGIAFDASGNLYAAIYNTTRLERYSSAGGSLGTFASVSIGSYGIAFDRGGSLYVADYFGGAIRKYSSTGADLGEFASGLGNPRDLVVVQACGDTFDFSGTQYTDCFRDVRRAGNVSAGSDLGGSGHPALNFTGSAAAAGDTWLTVYDDAEAPGPTIFSGNVNVSADVLIRQRNNKKGAGLVALYNEGSGKKGLALILYDSGNTDSLILATIDQGGKLTVLKTVSLGSAILENTWYRVTMDVAVTGSNFTVTGRVFKHEQASDPNSPLGGQVGATLSLPPTSLASKGLLAPGEVGIIASAIGAVVDSSVTNFTLGQ